MLSRGGLTPSSDEVPVIGRELMGWVLSGNIKFINSFKVSEGFP
jgi:hypothetical protein